MIMKPYTIKSFLKSNRYFLFLLVLLSSIQTTAQTISASNTAPVNFTAASGSMRVRNFGNANVDVLVGEAPGTSGKFNIASTASATSLALTYKWVSATNTLAVYKDGSTLLASYVYNIVPGLNSPKSNMLTVSLWA